MKNKTKKRKFLAPIVMATLITTLGVGALSYARPIQAATSSIKSTNTIAPYNTAGNKHGFGVGRGQGATGVVTAILGNNITITSGKNAKTYIVDASSANFLKTPTFIKGTKPGAPTSITLADIKIGDTIMIKGLITGNAIKATTVTDGNKVKINKITDNKLSKTGKNIKENEATEKGEPVGVTEQTEASKNAQ